MLWNTYSKPLFSAGRYVVGYLLFSIFSYVVGDLLETLVITRLNILWGMYSKPFFQQACMLWGTFSKPLFFMSKYVVRYLLKALDLHG